MTSTLASGKGLRHIKARTNSDIDAKEFGRLLRSAATLAKQPGASKANSRQ